MSARRLRIAAVGIAMIAPAGALGAGSKPATVAPTPAERAAILKAFGDPVAAAPCLITRLASSNHGYGTVRFRAKNSCRQWAFDGKNVFKRGKHGHWSAAFEGSSYRCPLPRIPRQVQRDLGLCR
jgi:hypothetical protein